MATRMRINPSFQSSSRSVCMLLLAAWLIFPSNAQAQQREDMATSRVPAEYETVVSAVQKVMGLLSDVTQRQTAEPINNQILAINDRLTLSGPVTGASAVCRRKTFYRCFGRLSGTCSGSSGSWMNEVRMNWPAALNPFSAISMMPSTKPVMMYASDEMPRIVMKSAMVVNVYPSGPATTIGGTKMIAGSAEAKIDPGSAIGTSGGMNGATPGKVEVSTRSMSPTRSENGISGGPIRPRPGIATFLPSDSYAFALDQWQYRIGAETRFGSRQHTPNVDLKIGGSYQRNTDTDDLWKASWGENTAASFFFRHDFFDYYQTEGWTGYAVARLTRYAQLSAAYRNEEYRSLSRNTNWSIFGEGNFRTNPGITEGLMSSVVLAFEGGSITTRNHQPKGVAFRLEAELGQGLGGDFDFSRYLGDLRTYARLAPEAGLSLRFRGGFTEGSVPAQKAFTLGGIGSVRGYGQNQFVGTRMALANAELSLYDPDIADWILDDITLFGTFDAGWTNLQAGSNVFSVEDMFASAGFGLALDDRNVRLEVSWPLQDLGTDYKPSVWLRFNPSF